MTREEAIWYLTPIAESASLERYKEALSMAVAALREQEERRWISVTERLPEDECRCLVFDAACDIEMDVYDGDGTFRLERCGAMQHPSYWTPLPEPPEEEHHE